MALINQECIGGPGLCSRSDATTSDRQGTVTANRQNQKKAKFQTPSTSNEARNYVKHNSVENISQDLVHLTKSDTASASLISLMKKGRKSQKLQIYLHLHPHWRELRNSPTLQDQESQRERILEGQAVHIVTFACKIVIKTLLQSGLVDYQSEKLNFGLYILHTRAV